MTDALAQGYKIIHTFTITKEAELFPLEIRVDRHNLPQ
jgi:hypothetical protein